ncbi:DNA (cytosine-5-)-methyltransferase [Psychrobacter sp. T6-1]
MKMPRFTFIDLFSGIGGFKMAFNSNNGKCLGFSEINKDAIEVYCHNYQIDESANFGDIRNIKSLPTHDLLTAGVPCQSWSIAGKNLGFNDDRGQLWNDTLYLLNQSRPKAFIFENVKGLVDPRNRSALNYILKRIEQAGYYANYYVINSHDYGVAQNRVRIYIIGFREKQFYDSFNRPEIIEKKTVLADILNVEIPKLQKVVEQTDLFGFNTNTSKSMSLSSKNGFNDYFLFNDLRNGETTIHSWDILDTTERQKEICLILLKNRRKKQFGLLDGNPISLLQFQSIDPSISKNELDSLVDMEILKLIPYSFEIESHNIKDLSEDEVEVLKRAKNNMLHLDELKMGNKSKVKVSSLTNMLETLINKGNLKCVEERYEFKNTKISSGINGINRIFLPTSDVFPTLVASDTNDYVALKAIPAETNESYKRKFLKEIYFENEYRKITKEEACQIQGFPRDFELPESRSRWMKLIGNSVSVPVIESLIKAIISTKVFD